MKSSVQVAVIGGTGAFAGGAEIYRHCPVLETNLRRAVTLLDGAPFDPQGGRMRE